MAFDHEEQEQLDTLKAWWAKYGNAATWVVVAGLAAYSGWTGWQYYQRTQAVEASSLYDALQEANGKDNAKVQRAAADIEKRYGSTSYAAMGALTAAKSAFDANDLKTAKAQLQWAIEHGNDEYKTVAKIRLAGVLLDEKAYDEALKTLGGDVPAQYTASVNDRKGDVLAAQNKLAEARAAYQAALAGMDKKSPARQLVELKLEAVGGTVPEEKPAAAA
ncbi:putative negative regulator of RcsB-dependent stress response [Pseudoduganella lurida]|uniref:Ancillary SecYEG translocon subunit n=1 Tax=Pseudoduganella lurida TaxID=1036180 RepID=A0A562RDB5_9BURK|nr:tetratricopeptide repeat protein [Pseudoduganella lurida]TWI66410.1 putative negative regulator of RcsB-dependent stress response [Pseudoduganella lurida]